MRVGLRSERGAKARDPKQYIQRMEQRNPELGKGWVEFVHTLSNPPKLLGLVADLLQEIG